MNKGWMYYCIRYQKEMSPKERKDHNCHKRKIRGKKVVCRKLIKLPSETKHERWKQK